MLIHAIKKVCSIKKVYFKNNSRSSPLLAVFIANIANFYFIFQIFQIFPVPTLALDSRDNSASQFFFFFLQHTFFSFYIRTRTLPSLYFFPFFLSSIFFDGRTTLNRTADLIMNEGELDLMGIRVVRDVGRCEFHGRF